MNGPFRINRPAPRAASAAAGGPPAGASGDEWLARLVKLVPSEVVAVYLAGAELAKAWLGTWAFICLLLVIVARAAGTRADGKPIQWMAVLVSSVSFVIWTYASGGHMLGMTLDPNTGIPSIAVLLWTFLVPYFYKGD